MRTRAWLEKVKAEGKSIGRPSYPLSIDEVRQLLKKDLPLAKIHRLLVVEGKICRKVNGKTRCINYEAFRRKVKQLLYSLN